MDSAEFHTEVYIIANELAVPVPYTSLAQSLLTFCVPIQKQ